VPNALPHITSTGIAWRGNPHCQVPRITTTPWNCSYRLAGQISPIGAIPILAQY